MRPACTHVALFCKDIEASVGFYTEHVGLKEVHRRVDDGTTVVWLGEEARGVPFVLVLLGVPPPEGIGPVAHLGYAVASKAEVRAAAKKGRDAGLTVKGPVSAGPIVGYYCLISDPDGNVVELSHGQSLDPPRDKAE